MMSRARWLLGWGLLSGTYLTLGVMAVIRDADWGAGLVYGVAATITFGFAAAMLPIVAPRPPDDDDDGPGGGGDPDGGEPPPPWWPEFERQFWWHVRGLGPGRSRPREKTPA